MEKVERIWRKESSLLKKDKRNLSQQVSYTANVALSLQRINRRSGRYKSNFLVQEVAAQLGRYPTFQLIALVGD